MRSYYCVVSTVDEIICQDVQVSKTKKQKQIDIAVKKSRKSRMKKCLNGSTN